MSDIKGDKIRIEITNLTQTFFTEEKKAQPVLIDLKPVYLYFACRNELIDLIAKKLVSTAYSPSCLITLTGPAGVGKTQLATEIGHKFARNYTNIFFIDGSCEENFLSYYKLMYVALTEKATALPQDLILVKTVNTLLTEKNSLFLAIIDNVSDFAIIEQYLPTRNGHIILTSRSAIPRQQRLKCLCLMKKNF